MAAAGPSPVVEPAGPVKMSPVGQKSTRYNNPYNVEYRPWQDKYGATLGDDGRFGQYPNPEAGVAAAVELIQKYAADGHSLSSAIEKFAPTWQNPNTPQRIVDTAKVLGVSPDTPLADVPLAPFMTTHVKYESPTEIDPIVFGEAGSLPIGRSIGKTVQSPETELMKLAGDSNKLSPEALMQIASGGAPQAAEVLPNESSKAINTMSQVAQPNVVQEQPLASTDTTEDTLAQFSRPTGEMIGEAIDMPFKYLLRKPLESLHEKLIEPQRAQTEEEFARFIKEPGAGTAAPEAFAGLPPKETFVPVMELALAGPLMKMLGTAGRAAGLKLPAGEVAPVTKIAGSTAFKEPEVALADALASIKTELAKPVTPSIAEITAANKPTGMIPAPSTSGQIAENLVDKYGEALSKTDINLSIFGKLSGEVPVFGFERMERQAGITGLKEDIWFRNKDLQKAAQVEYKEVEKASREVQAVLPGDSGKRIYNYAIGQQKGGPEILAKMGETPVTELVGAESAAYQQMRQGFDNLLGRWNEARVAVGKDSIEGVDNYFTFIRRYTALANKQINPTMVDAKYFKPLDINVPYEIQRAESNLPLVMDAFKVYRRYNKSVLDYIYQAPHTAGVRNLAKSVAKSSPNTAAYLTQWTDQVMGLSKMKERLFGGGAKQPTTWLGKSVDWTANKIAGVRPVEEGLDQTVDKLINNVGVSTLSGYARTAMVQPSSMVMATGEVGPVNMIKGIKDSAFPSKWKYAKENSSVLSTREFDVNIAESIERMVSESKLGKLKRAATEIGYAPLHYMDSQAAMATWWGAYRRGLSSGMQPGKELFRYADDVVVKTQISAAKGDLSKIQTHTLGKALTQFQTFVLGEGNYLMDIIPGLKSNNLSFGQKLAKTTRVAAAAGLANMVYEDVFGIESPMPTFAGAIGKAMREDKNYLGIGMDVAKEASSMIPVISGARYTGGSPFGPIAQFATDVASTVKGEPSRVPLWTLPLRLRGVPFTAQLERLTRVPGKLSLGEALFGKMQPDKPKALPREKSHKQIMEGQSYIKDLFPDLDLGL